MKLNRKIKMRYTPSFGMDIKILANVATQATNTFLMDWWTQNYARQTVNLDTNMSNLQGS